MGSCEAAVVMGISARADEMVHMERIESTDSAISLIRRFSGGGTVVVDQNTLFFTLILAKNTILTDYHNPQGYMEWIYQLLYPAFQPHQFTLQENDFTLFNKKIGGNAQCFTKERLLHHTSFLWRWEKEKMELLRHPKKRPLYRQDRFHETFCSELHSFYSSPASLIEAIQDQLLLYFTVLPRKKEDREIKEALKIPHRKTVERLQIASPEQINLHI